MDSARGSENLDRGTTRHLAGFVGGAPVLGWGCQAHMGPARPRQSLGKDLRARLVAHLFRDVGGDTPSTDVLVCDPPPYGSWGSEGMLNMAYPSRPTSNVFHPAHP